MINRVSYQILPSGGLSTMESQMSLVPEYGAIGFESGDESAMSGDLMWGDNDQLFKDYPDGSDSSSPPIEYEEREGLPRAHTDTRLHDAVGNLQQMGHYREPSNIFNDLPKLREPPTIQQVISNIQRGTFSFNKLFGARQPKEEAGTKSRLKRSRTEPDTHRFLAHESHGSG
ncbi:hypothetical protein FGB62_16g144 [Gracilaria domingensis]|nr:hypothetical protein FGB62_16g144 [Gracilaria domingensis]